MLKQEDNGITIVTLGESNVKRRLYEAMNIASVFNLPILFIINNNRYAISTPIDKQTRCTVLANKADSGIKSYSIEAYNIEQLIPKLIQIKKYVQKGRPAVVECITERRHDHTTSDNHSQYRESDELENIWHNDPISKFKQQHSLDIDENHVLNMVQSELDYELEQFMNIKAISLTEMMRITQENAK